MKAVSPKTKKEMRMYFPSLFRLSVKKYISGFVETPGSAMPEIMFGFLRSIGFNKLRQ